MSEALWCGAAEGERNCKEKGTRDFEDSSMKGFGILSTSPLTEMINPGVILINNR